MPAIRPPPPIAITSVSSDGIGLDHLEAAGALPGDDRLVVVRMDDRRGRARPRARRRAPSRRRRSRLRGRPPRRSAACSRPSRRARSAASRSPRGCPSATRDTRRPAHGCRPRPRSRRAPLSSGVSAFSLLSAPRSLNDAVNCRFSNLSQTSAPTMSDSVRECTNGVSSTSPAMLSRAARMAARSIKGKGAKADGRDAICRVDRADRPRRASWHGRAAAIRVPACLPPSSRPPRPMNPLAITAFTATTAARTRASPRCRDGARAHGAADSLPNDFTGGAPASTLPTFIGRVRGGRRRAAAAATSQAIDCRNNRLAWLALAAGRFPRTRRAAVARHGARAGRGADRHQHVDDRGERSGVPRARGRRARRRSSATDLHHLHATTAFVARRRSASAGPRAPSRPRARRARRCSRRRCG